MRRFLRGVVVASLLWAGCDDGGSSGGGGGAGGAGGGAIDASATDSGSGGGNGGGSGGGTGGSTGGATGDASLPPTDGGLFDTSCEDDNDCHFGGGACLKETGETVGVCVHCRVGKDCPDSRPFCRVDHTCTDDSDALRSCSADLDCAASEPVCEIEPGRTYGQCVGRADTGAPDASPERDAVVIPDAAVSDAATVDAAVDAANAP